MSSISVAIPVYNEERNLPPLLDALLREPAIDAILVVDDASTDASVHVATDYSRRYPIIVALSTGGRRGPLAGWRTAIAASQTPIVVLVDADTRPAPGAIEKLVGAIAASADVVTVSGRVEPANDLTRYPAGRFRAAAIRRLRLLNYPRDAVIGRFAAVRRDWFLQQATAENVVACDAYLGCVADSNGLKARYVDDAVCYYTEVTNSVDFASQRQRADAGYAQLRSMGILRPSQEPHLGDFLRVLSSAAFDDLPGAAAWCGEQIKAKFVRAYRPGSSGSWDSLDRTKDVV